MTLCADCGKEHYRITHTGVAVLIPETIKGCPAFKRVATSRINPETAMTLRDEFEKLCPVPNYLEYDKKSRNYRIKIGFDRSNTQLLMSCEHYCGQYKGFLLGRQTQSVPTVSVEKYREDVEAAFLEGWNEADMGGGEAGFCIENDFDSSQAKRRTEEV